MMKLFPLCLIAILLLAFPAFAQNDFESIQKKVEELGNQGKFNDAIAELNKVIELQPNDANLILRRAEFHWFAKNNQALLNDVQKAVSINPSDKQILYFGTQLLNRTGNYEQALKNCNELFALGEPDYWTWQLIAQIKTNLKDFAGAFEDVSNAVELFPEDTRFKQNQAILISLMGNSKKAIEIYTSFISANEKKLSAEKDENKKERFKYDLSQLLFKRSRIYFENFDKESAQVDLIKAVETLPTASIYYQRARHYIMFKMPTEALPDLNKAIELGKDKADFGYFLDRGDIYFEMQKYSEAIQDYEQVIKRQDTLTELMQKRVVLAKQKMQQDTNQPK
jgi:tetratricopeptide (TPR) repeat protein